MPKVHFSPLKEEHIDQIMRIEHECFTAPWTRGMFASELDNPLALYYVATLEGEVIGYIGMWQIINEGHITTVAVAPEYRRKGIARALLDLLIRKTREHFLFLTLEVRRSNIAAKRLYSSFGFTITGERKDYYEDNHEDADIMTLYLWEENDES